MTAAFARATAIAIALAAVADPRVPIPRRQAAVIRVVGNGVDASSVTSALANAGFTIDSSRREAATVLITTRVPRLDSTSSPTWIVDATAAAPNVRIADVRAAATRVPGQALDVVVTVDGRGVNGETTEIILEDRGLPVASARRQWTGDRDRWSAHLQYLPPSAGASRLRVRARALSRETSVEDNVADVAVPPARGPLRILVVEASVTWPALFVRRALEGESAFSVAAVQRASRAVATRAGTPPAALTRASLAPFEVVIVGGAESLPAADVDVLRWFVELRGGIVVLVPDREPAGAYLELTGARFDVRTEDTPVRLSGGLLASEIATPREQPLSSSTLAADAEGRPVVIAIRRGAGGLIFSGALDAWRQRGQDDDAFTRFWRRAIAAQGLTVPPALDVTVSPAIARPGERVSIVARIRGTELPSATDRLEVPRLEARAVDPLAKTDEPLRLWPAGEPGTFAGEWRPQHAGQYDVAVSAGAIRGDAPMTVADDVMAAAADSEDLELAARASGGRRVTMTQLGELIAGLRESYPSPRGVEPVFLMRSPWWCVPFAVLLCTEWALRRTRGLS